MILNKFILDTLSMAFKLLCLTTLCAFMLSKFAFANDIQIELKKSVTIAHDEVRLGDLANLTTTDLATLLRFSNIPMGHAPRPDVDIIVDRETIAKWLRIRLGHVANQIAWSGSRQVLVRTVSHQIDTDQLVLAAKNELQSWLTKKTERSEVQVLPPSMVLTAPSGNVTFKARSLGDSTKLQPHMTVLVELWASDRFLRLVPISFDVHAYSSGWIARRDVIRGEMITAEILQQHEIDLTTLNSPLLGRDTDVPQDMRARQKISKGAVLLSTQIEPTPVVQVGETAILSVKTGLVDLESGAQVLQDGKMGDLVRIKLASSAGPVLAKVVGPGRLEMR